MPEIRSVVNAGFGDFIVLFYVIKYDSSSREFSTFYRFLKKAAANKSLNEITLHHNAD